MIREVGLNWQALRDWLHKRDGDGGSNDPNIPDSTEDWHAGDIAVCAQDGGWHYRGHGSPAPGPALGEMRKVVEVSLCDAGCQYLHLLGYAPGRYHAACFTKLRGDKAEACTERFARQIKRQKVGEPELV